MSVFQAQYTRSLEVIPSDNANIPYPNLIKSGVISDIDTNKLIDETANFILDNIQAGDIVYSLNTDLAATVIQVDSETSLLLNANIFSGSGQSYLIYNASSQTSNGNPGCYLYVGSEGNVKVTTVGQDIVVFSGVRAGTVLPIQVVKVHSGEGGTTAGEIIALW
jgi:hypothetical protein